MNIRDASSLAELSPTGEAMQVLAVGDAAAVSPDAFTKPYRACWVTTSAHVWARFDGQAAAADNGHYWPAGMALLLSKSLVEKASFRAPALGSAKVGLTPLA